MDRCPVCGCAPHPAVLHLGSDTPRDAQGKPLAYVIRYSDAGTWPNLSEGPLFFRVRGRSRPQPAASGKRRGNY